MALYDDRILDEVRNSVNIVTLVSGYVPDLRKKGRDFAARCPFHDEKTPSFYVSEEKQIFKCFGCGAGGDVFGFVMKREGMSFHEAVQFLAERSGIALPSPTSKPDDLPSVNKNDLHRLMAEATAAYQQALLTSAEGKPALQYLQNRGVSLDAIAKFQLGYSPSGGNFLVSFLQKKGFSVEAMAECGLCRRSEDGNRTYDYFRGRVMFPIADIQGRPIAFGARAMDDRPPKYLNSPETRLYNKSRNLFGLCHARGAVRDRGYAVLVEGYMDCIVPFQHGVDNIVASCGTALTKEQVDLLGRYARDVVVSYDADAAGQNAAQKSLELFLEGDFRVRVLRLPEGKDPDEYVRKAGAEQYRARIDEAVPYLEFVLDKAVRAEGGAKGIADPRAKVRAMNAVLPFLARVPSPVERSEYAAVFARRLGIEDRLLLGELRKAAQEKRTALAQPREDAAVGCKPAEKRLLRLLLEHAGLQDAILPHCEEEDFEGLAGAKIFSIILKEFQEGRRDSFESLRRRFTGEQDQEFLTWLEMGELPEEPTASAAESCLNALRTLRWNVLRDRIAREIAEAGERGDDEAVNRLLAERANADKELLRIAGK